MFLCVCVCVCVCVYARVRVCARARARVCNVDVSLGEYVCVFSSCSNPVKGSTEPQVDHMQPCAYFGQL